jgi:hypothetical protein
MFNQVIRVSDSDSATVPFRTGTAKVVGIAPFTGFTMLLVTVVIAITMLLVTVVIEAIDSPERHTPRVPKSYSRARMSDSQA